MVIVSENIGGSFCLHVVKYFFQATYHLVFRQESLKAHNAYRSKHGVPALNISAEINAVAQVPFYNAF